MEESSPNLMDQTIFDDSKDDDNIKVIVRVRDTDSYVKNKINVPFYDQSSSCLSVNGNTITV